MIRVTDRYLQQTFIDNLTRSKKTLNDLQTKMATQKSISKPSDNPLGSARITRFQNQISDITTYTKNIDNGNNFLKSGITAMEGMQSEVQNILTNITSANSAANSDMLPSYAQKIDTALKSILQYANTDLDGKYLFAGTATSSVPFDTASWYGVSNSLGGDQKIKIANSAEQKINISGEELFYPVVSQKGSFDKNAAVGSTLQNSQVVADALGKEYTVQMTYTKTAAQQYTMQYEVRDSQNNAISSGTSQMAFDAVTGELKTLGGTAPAKIAVDLPAAKVNFLIDPTGMTEGSTSALQGSTSQKANILNVLSSVKERLASGLKPTDEQVALIQNFDSHILQKLSDAGGMQNRMDSMAEMMQTQELQLETLMSKESDVDVAKAAIEMQSAQYSTDLLYKTSAMLLPKSLLDYL